MRYGCLGEGVNLALAAAVAPGGGQPLQDRLSPCLSSLSVCLCPSLITVARRQYDRRCDMVIHAGPLPTGDGEDSSLEKGENLEDGGPQGRSRQRP